jgi:hypothetical protein
MVHFALADFLLELIGFGSESGQRWCKMPNSFEKRRDSSGLAIAT